MRISHVLCEHLTAVGEATESELITWYLGRAHDGMDDGAMRLILRRLIVKDRAILVDRVVNGDTVLVMQNCFYKGTRCGAAVDV